MNKERGFVMASLIITTTLVMLIGVAITGLVVTNYRLATEERNKINAQFAADAGLDYAIAQLNISNSWTTTAGEYDLFDDGNTRATYSAAVSAGAGTNTVTIQTTGRIYDPAGATDPTVERTYEVELRGLSSGGTFSIVTGVGGLIMNNNSKIVAGDVFVNGEISLRNSAQIGLSTAPVTVKAAHQNCPDPPNAAYPEVCNSAIHGSIGEPITIQNPAQIYGTVTANNQSTSTGMSNPGLVAGSVTPQPLPTHDRAAQIAAVTNTISGNFNCNSNSALLSIPANTRITGGVDLKKKCRVIINGDVWVEGDIDMVQTTQFEVSDSVGTTRPNIMVDGEISLRNSARVVANIDDTGVALITYKSNVSCSISTSSPCDVTGTNLYNSRNLTTITFDNSASAPESLLFAKWSRVTIVNSGDIGALVGQTVELNNTATITFGTTAGGGSPSFTYIVDAYRRTYD
jgi:hypothetical protein